MLPSLKDSLTKLKIAETVVWSITFLIYMFVYAHFSKRISVFILFAITAAGVLYCDGHKTSPRTSPIVQIMFSFWSFEISEDMLSNQKLIICLDSFSQQRLIYWAPLSIILGFVSTTMLKVYNYSDLLCLHVAKSKGSLAETAVWPVTFLIYMPTALKVYQFFILIYYPFCITVSQTAMSSRGSSEMELLLQIKKLNVSA